MFRLCVAATAVCVAAALAGAEEKEKVVFDRKITHVRYDPSAKKELGRKENVEAKADGDPAKDAELLWNVRPSTFDTAPVVGDLFLDDKGQAWSVLRRIKTRDDDQYLFACRKLAQPPVPPAR